MDVDDVIVLAISLWAVIGFIAVNSVAVYVTILLIGLLIMAEISGSFIKPEARRGLRPAIYFLLFVFLIIVVRKTINVLT